MMMMVAKFTKVLTFLPFTLVSCWRSEHVPEWLWTNLARRRHVIADLNQLVALIDLVAGILVLLHRHVKILFVGSASFTLASVEQLKNSRNLFGIGTNDVALRHRTNVEHFAAEQIKVLNFVAPNLFFQSHLKSKIKFESRFCLSCSLL